jgi:hypothetical protein
MMLYIFQVKAVVERQPDNNSRSISEIQVSKLKTFFFVTDEEAK